MIFHHWFEWINSNKNESGTWGDAADTLTHNISRYIDTKYSLPLRQSISLIGEPEYNIAETRYSSQQRSLHSHQHKSYYTEYTRDGKHEWRILLEIEQGIPQ